MVMTGALPALAGWWISYPGSMGVRADGTIIPQISWSTIGNPSTSTWLYLDLPVIMNPFTFNMIDFSHVRVIDQHPSSNIRCQLCSVYLSGCTRYGWFSAKRYSSGSGCNEQVLSPGMIEGNTISHCYFSCEIPPMYNNNISYINSYSVQDSTHW